jgi:hypothetical protein
MKPEPKARRREGAKSRGPKPGAVRRFDEADRALFPEIKELMRTKSLSLGEAARALANDGRVAGRGTIDSRARRLAIAYRAAPQN